MKISFEGELDTILRDMVHFVSRHNLTVAADAAGIPEKHDLPAETQTQKPAAKGKGKGKASAKKEAAPKSEDKEVSVDDCRAALSGLASKKTTKVARAIMLDFNVSQVSDVPEDKRVDFVAACNAAASEE